MPSRTVSDFLGKFGESLFPNHDLLLPALHEGDGVAGTFVPNQPCNEYSYIYRVRARMLGREGGADSERLQGEFNELADKLDETPEQPCRLWMFTDSTRRFFVFENAQSEAIVGCVWWHQES